MSDVQSVVTDASERAARAVAEQMDKELYGAWRAGYDYIHVYEALDCAGVRMDAFSVTQYILPSNTEEPPHPDVASYICTYDLTDVPTDELRDAWRRRSE